CLRRRREWAWTFTGALRDEVNLSRCTVASQGRLSDRLSRLSKFTKSSRHREEVLALNAGRERRVSAHSITRRDEITHALAQLALERRSMLGIRIEVAKNR